MSRLRSYAPMKKVSDKVAAEASAFKAVYQAVDQRSEGRCEVSALREEMDGEVARGVVPAYERCRRRAVDHHHLYKPRRANHVADQVVHVCRICHDRMEWPFQRGRLAFVGRLAAAFLFAIRYSSDKAFR